jgi:hypothetical protein
VLLAQEPWCFDPDRLARVALTQAEIVYLEPAEWLNRADEGRGPGRVADPFADGIPDRSAFVARMDAATPGRTRAHWNAVYDRLLAEQAARAAAQPADPAAPGPPAD